MEDLAPFDGTLPYYPHARLVSHAQLEGLAWCGALSPGRATVLFCWELGGGLGHLMQMLPLAEDLVKAGHRVYVALRDLDRAGALYASAGVSFLQAPIWLSGAVQFARPATYAQLLANCGFGSNAALFARACAWRNLINMVAPDLVVFDHAPTALLASRALSKPPRRALIGSGFCSPPDEPVAGEPWAVVRADEARDIGFDRLREDDAAVLARCNWVLGKWGQPPLERLGQLYSEVDENFLTTFPELDHFPDRRGAGYWGPVVAAAPGGEPPHWPDAQVRRAFVYLKDGAAAEAALAGLAEASVVTVAYVEGAGAETRRKLESTTARLSPRPLDLRAAAAECDLAVLGGGHGTTAEVLLAGKPVLELPAAREQRMVADAVARLGAGEVAQPKRGDDVRTKLSLMLTSDGYRRAAERFSRRYSMFDPSRQGEAMLGRCEQILSNPGAEIISQVQHVRAFA